MGDRYFPNTLSDYVVPSQDVNEDSPDVQAEAGISREASFSDCNVILKAAIALKDEVSSHPHFAQLIRSGCYRGSVQHVS